jgi:hypothetical protein
VLFIRKRAESVTGLADLALQDVVDDGGYGVEIAVRIADASADDEGRHFYIALGHGFRDRTVERFIEIEDAAVESFPGIAGVGLTGRDAGAACQKQQQA